MQFDPLKDYSIHDLKDPEHLVNWNFSELIKTLITLAADPDRQLQIMNSNNAANEMLLDFESFYGLSARKYVQAKLISYPQAEALDALKELLDLQEQEEDDSDTLFDDPLWETIREKAGSVLQLMNFGNLDIQLEKTFKSEEKHGGERKNSEQVRRKIVRKK